MNAARHETYTRKVGGQFVARCSCGWSSKCRDTEDGAREDADEHVAKQPDDDEPEEIDPADRWTYCGSCNGSGEGIADGTRCRTCKGRGEVYVE